MPPHSRILMLLALLLTSANTRATETTEAPPTSPPASSSEPPAKPTAPADVPAPETHHPGLIIPGLTASGAPGQGFTISTDDGRYSLNLRGRFQLRDTANHPTTGWTNEMNIKTLRLIISGHLLSPKIGYYLQLAEGPGDFDSTSPSPIYDAFIESTHLRDLNVRVGQFFVPFDRARTIRESALDFVDRQQVVSELSLDRDVGIRIFSDDVLGLHGWLGYSVGVFGGEGKNQIGGTVPGLLYVARLQVKPFGLFDDDIEGDLERIYRPRLALGGAFAWNQHTDRQKSTFGTVLTKGTFNYAHADADLVFKYGGFSFLSEFLYRQGSPDFILVPGSTASDKPTKEWTRNARGYVVQAGYMVLDQLEVVGRFDQLIAIGQTDPTLVSLASQQGREAGGGVNLYLNHHQLKIQSDYFRYWGPSDGHGRGQVRLQLDVSI